MFPPAHGAPTAEQLRFSDSTGHRYDNDLVFSITKAFIYRQRNYYRERVVVLSRHVFPSMAILQSLPHAQARRQYCRGFAAQANIPPLYSCDIVLFPFLYTDHFILIVGDVNTGILYIVDPVGPQVAYTRAECKKICEHFNDLWAYNADDLRTDRSFWTLASAAERREFFRTYNLPVQPEQDSANCGPLVCLHACIIATGRPFLFVGFEDDEQYLRSPRVHTCLLYTSDAADD